MARKSREQHDRIEEFSAPPPAICVAGSEDVFPGGGSHGSTAPYQAPSRSPNSATSRTAT